METIIVQHSDIEGASRFKPGRWIQIDNEPMQIVSIEQLTALRDRILVTRVVHEHDETTDPS